MAITENLISDYKRVQGGPESQRKDGMQRLCGDVTEGWQSKHFSVARELDFDKLMKECVSEPVREQLRSSNRDLVEVGLDVMASTQFPNLLGTAISVGTFEYCQMAPNTIMNEVTMLNAGCGQEVFYGWHQIGDVVDDDCMDEKEMTPYKGICKPTKLTSPPRCKKKFAMGITREMLCFDVNSNIQNLMRTGAEVANLHNSKMMLRTMFALHRPGANPYPYIEDDIAYDTYFKTTGSPWINRLDGNVLDGTYTPFNTVEFAAEDLRDPVTGEPVNCQFRDILVTSVAARDAAMRGLGPFSATFDKTDTAYGSNLKLTQDRPADSRFGRVIYDRYARDLLSAWYTDVVGLSAAGAKDGASKTWLVGDFKNAFGWVVEWPLETLERVGTDTREYWDQEIVYQIKYLWKAAPIVLNPRAVFQCVPTLSGLDGYTAANYAWV